MNVQNGVLLGALLAVIVYAIRDGFLFWILIRWAFGRSGSASVPVPGAGSVGPGPLPGPAPQPAKPPPPRFTDIVATSFAGQGDAENSAYTERLIDPAQLGYALPYHFSGTPPTITVSYNGKAVSGVPGVDIGPWNTDDPYWNTAGGRPQAETGTDNSGRRTNLAGLDLTPGTWEALGVSPSQSSAVKAKVTWDFDSYLAGTTPSAPAQPPAPVGDPPWIVLGRSFDGLVWTTASGPMPAKIQTWMDNIATVFPEMAAYCQGLKTAGAKGWWPWCGLFVQAMLSYSNIRGPMSAAGLKGEETTSDWAYAEAWANWGTKVWMPENGDISNANPQTGDVLVWGFGHVSFYNAPEPTTNTFSSLGGDQGTPLRVCIEDIAMSECIAIRRPPVPGAPA